MKKSQKEKPQFSKTVCLLAVFSLTLISGCVEIPIHLPEGIRAESYPEKRPIQVAAPAPVLENQNTQPFAQTNTPDESLKCLVLYSPLSIDQDKSLVAEKARDTINSVLKSNGIATHNKMLAKMIEGGTNSDEFSVPDEELKIRARQRGVNCLAIFHLEWGPENRTHAQLVLRAKAYNISTGKLLGITEKFGQAYATTKSSRRDSHWMLAAVRAAQKGTSSLVKKIKISKQVANQSEIYTLIFTGFNETEMDGIYETISDMKHSKVNSLNYEPQKLQIELSRPNSNWMQVKIDIKNRFRQLNFPLKTRRIEDNRLHFIRSQIR